MEEVEKEGREVSIAQLEELGPGVEFYPVDSLSRGMVDRLRVFNRSLPNMVYLPHEDMDDSTYMRNSWARQHTRELYQVGHITFSEYWS